ncbi:hypothetical protein RvY_12760 [Ramazzottius varieornatus]|uniref:Uncharacterized protein n=1 Tax=Ramazzottius varieornatus TaxID=947166 RepID=A0A1D1VMK8_RAMVA|nr:hypothetical protein RvY_12760 [Ramazzottius varieornatus]
MAAFGQEYIYERVEERHVDDDTGEVTVEVGEDWGGQDVSMNYKASPPRTVKQPPSLQAHYKAPASTPEPSLTFDDFPLQEIPLNNHHGAVPFPKSGVISSS